MGGGRRLCTVSELWEVFAVYNKFSQGISADDHSDVLSENIPRSERKLLLAQTLRRGVYTSLWIEMDLWWWVTTGCVLLSLKERIKDPNSSLLPFIATLNPVQWRKVWDWLQKRQSEGFEI